MKTRKILSAFFPFFLFFVIIDFSNCKKDQSPLDDPCEDAVETTADFGFYLQRSYKGEKFYIPIRDTFYNDLKRNQTFF
ncbi:MAG: hypothetical protein DWQ02_07785 [Bacteroidetes bacterium]|nr:MAG: hypothetical protein DWQ02_07785 [Bacteroidota bacterium]